MHLMAALRSGDPSVVSLLESVQTYRADGRDPVVELYRAQVRLVDELGWAIREVFTDTVTTPSGHPIVLPASALMTSATGPALWILAGIHGEEPAGPNALVRHLPEIVALQRAGVPLVVLPLCNPVGYCRSWRYPNSARSSEACPGRSVGDSEHWLPDPTGRARSPKPSSRECEALTRTVIEPAQAYPPMLSLDFHEDDVLDEGCLYSQGPAGATDRVGRTIVAELQRHRFPIAENGETRFQERISGGMIGEVKDGSIDELLAAAHIVRDGSLEAGPAGRNVLVIETSSKATALPARIAGHGCVLGMLGELWEIANKEA